MKLNFHVYPALAVPTDADENSLPMLTSLLPPVRHTWVMGHKDLSQIQSLPDLLVTCHIKPLEL